MVLEGNPDVGSPRTSDLQHPGSQGSCILSSGEDVQPGEEPIKYGELIVLGYNGCLSSGDKGRRRSRLALNRRPHANGVKPDVMHHISTPLVSKALSNRGQHSISYTLSRSHSVIVEYTHDSDTDMFQIGRSTENMIDFVVTDTSPGGGVAEGPSPQSTISRYACRILCDRRPPYIARIYAAGFDASSNIFLGVSEPQAGPSASSESGERVQCAAGRLPHRPVRGHAALAHAGGAAAGTHAEAAGGPAAGSQRRAAPVPRGPQHPGLPQPRPGPHGA
uniref:Pellino E3 ubiquitin protein ligase family member 3 n=1 Tax=Myotis myotis TaxID=51298 RepID=A0A7J7VJL7_MYOMY|nr:pellino E3 ubiquitin protein ligase family member 3 [Myotis myotis]